MEYSSKIKRATGLILMFSLNETVDRLAMEKRVCCYDHALQRKNGHVLRMALDFEVKGERGHGKSRLREKTWRLD